MKKQNTKTNQISITRILMEKRGKKIILKPFFFFVVGIFLLTLIIAPTLDYIYNSSTGEGTFFNQTELANGTGIRQSAAVLSMDFNNAPETYNPFIYGGQYVKDNSIYNNGGVLN